MRTLASTPTTCPVVRTPYSWTCLAASFATCLGITFEEICARVGHDGSEVIHPELPDPECRRAFHIQEMIEVAMELGYSVTPIEARPVLAARGARSLHPVEFRQGNAYRLNRRMEGHRGVLTGLNLANRPHAVYWDGSLCHDPAGRTVGGVWRPWSCGPHLFQIETFWRCSREHPAADRPQEQSIFT